MKTIISIFRRRLITGKFENRLRFLALPKVTSAKYFKIPEKFRNHFLVVDRKSFGSRCRFPRRTWNRWNFSKRERERGVRVFFENFSAKSSTEREIGFQTGMRTKKKRKRAREPRGRKNRNIVLYGVVPLCKSFYWVKYNTMTQLHITASHFFFSFDSQSFVPFI